MLNGVPEGHVSTLVEPITFQGRRQIVLSSFCCSIMFPEGKIENSASSGSAVRVHSVHVNVETHTCDEAEEVLQKTFFPKERQ